MNRILLFIVVLLVPVTIVISGEKETKQVLASKEVYNLEWQLNENSETEIEQDEKPSEVLVSNNANKSEAFYVGLDDYIIGVVAGEMPASFNMEALKAQAVAARTYALYKMQNIPGYVLATSVNDQVYLSEEEMQNRWGNNYEYYYNRIKEAVLSTKDEVITYDGDIIISYYFAISNGYTDDGKTVFNDNKDYLVSVPSVWDKNYPDAYISKATLSKGNFCNSLNISCDSITISNVIRGENNYVREITINGEAFTGREVFNKLGLKSTDFEITSDGDAVFITTYGFGHSVGMSQYGAEGMANEGYNYQDILKHYYKGTEIEKI